MFDKNTLVVATGNKGKLREIREILSGITVLGLPDLTLDITITEDGETFEENALKKASTIASLLSVPVLADDSGLCVSALGGRPGVYSARFAGENATDQDNMEKLLQELSDVPEGKRSASFVCVMCLVMPDGGKFFARGETEGKILFAPQGENGFGYDPLFFNTEFQKSFAELDAEEKNAISHRGRALSEMKKILQEIFPPENR